MILLQSSVSTTLHYFTYTVTLVFQIATNHMGSFEAVIQPQYYDQPLSTRVPCCHAPKISEFYPLYRLIEAILLSHSWLLQNCGIVSPWPCHTGWYKPLVLFLLINTHAIAPIRAKLEHHQLQKPFIAFLKPLLPLSFPSFLFLSALQSLARAKLLSHGEESHGVCETAGRCRF